MKIKRAEGVQQIQVISLKPEPQIYVSYDGLSGLSNRPILRDLMEEVERGTAKTRETPGRKGKASSVSKEDLVKSLRENGSGRVHVYFSDYVSYGEGAGEEVAEFFFRSMLLLYQSASKSPDGIEKLLLQHAPGAVEEVPLAPN